MRLVERVFARASGELRYLWMAATRAGESIPYSEFMMVKSAPIQVRDEAICLWIFARYEAGFAVTASWITLMKTA